MQLVEVFLPLETKRGQSIGPEVIENIVGRLADRFGGATAFTRAPADGLWKQGAIIQKDRIVIVEILVEELDQTWWKDYRARLEIELEQDEVLIRATPCQKI